MAMAWANAAVLIVFMVCVTVVVVALIRRGYEIEFDDHPAIRRQEKPTDE